MDKIFFICGLNTLYKNENGKNPTERFLPSPTPPSPEMMVSTAALDTKLWL